jgi:hypothetical protein
MTECESRDRIELFNLVIQEKEEEREAYNQMKGSR